MLFQRGAHAALAFQAGRLHGSLGDPDPFIGQTGLARRGLNRQIGFQLRLALRGTRHFELGLGRGTRRFGLARIENDQGTIGDLRGDIGTGRGRGMRGARAFGFKRQRSAGSRVGQLAAVANARRAVERGLARVLLRDSPRGGDRFQRGFARGLGRKLGARGIRPFPLERGDGGALFAGRCERIPTGLLVHALDRGGCLLIVIAIDCARIEAKTGQGFFELADVAAAGSGRHVAKGRCSAAEDKDRTAGCG